MLGRTYALLTDLSQKLETALLAGKQPGDLFSSTREQPLRTSVATAIDYYTHICKTLEVVGESARGFDALLSHVWGDIELLRGWLRALPLASVGEICTIDNFHADILAERVERIGHASLDLRRAFHERAEVTDPLPPEQQIGDSVVCQQRNFDTVVLYGYCLEGLFAEVRGTVPNRELLVKTLGFCETPSGYLVRLFPAHSVLQAFIGHVSEWSESAGLSLYAGPTSAHPPYQRHALHLTVDDSLAKESLYYVEWRTVVTASAQSMPVTRHGRERGLEFRRCGELWHVRLPVLYLRADQASKSQLSETLQQLGMAEWYPADNFGRTRGSHQGIPLWPLDMQREGLPPRLDNWQQLGV